ncbi:hypothetical protein LB507_009584 [Fusarium sp. FIESC RH6]|nr:hypothetical protein LB507_009584 [Fusarium sp. FIESC RH6]
MGPSDFQGPARVTLSRSTIHRRPSPDQTRPDLSLTLLWIHCICIAPGSDLVQLRSTATSRKTTVTKSFVCLCRHCRLPNETRICTLPCGLSYQLNYHTKVYNKTKNKEAETATSRYLRGDRKKDSISPYLILILTNQNTRLSFPYALAHSPAKNVSNTFRNSHLLFVSAL